MRCSGPTPGSRLARDDGTRPTRSTLHTALTSRGVPYAMLLFSVALAGEVTAELVPVQASYRIGEPLWMELVVHNDGDRTVDATFLPRFTSQPVLVEAVGPDGRRALDPYHARI